MPRRLNQIPDVLTPGLIIVIFIITVLIPVSYVVKALRIPVTFQYIIILVLHKTQPSTKLTTTIQMLCVVKALVIPFKRLYKSLIFLQDC